MALYLIFALPVLNWANEDTIINYIKTGIARLYKSLWEKMQEFEDDFKKMEFGGKKLIVFLDDIIE